MSFYDDDKFRGAGRTTALMLHAMANAIEHPNETVEFKDHAEYARTVAGSINAAERMCALAGVLDLDMVFTAGMKEVFIDSHWPRRAAPAKPVERDQSEAAAKECVSQVRLSMLAIFHHNGRELMKENPKFIEATARLEMPAAAGEAAQGIGRR